MGLRSYVDEEVMSVLSEYGVVKSKVIRLKENTDNELARMENGISLVNMILDKPFI